jgi:hypothetical protein
MYIIVSMEKKSSIYTPSYYAVISKNENDA